MVNPEGIYTSEAQPSKPYEKYHASERFVEMADLIIGRLDVADEETDENYRSCAWVNPVLGESYSLIREQSKQAPRTIAGRKRTVSNYWLNVYSGSSNNAVPIERYAVTADGHMLHAIRSIDSKGKMSFSHSDNTEAARKSLDILSEFLPKESERILQDKFDRDFEYTVGRYVLSELSYVRDEKDKTESIDPEKVIDSVVAHMGAIDKIEQSVRDTSIRQNAKENPALHEAVIDAIKSKPVSGRRHSNYIDVNLSKAAAKIGSGLYSGWTHKIVVKRKQRPS